MDIAKKVTEHKLRIQAGKFADFQRLANQLADDVCETLGNEFTQQLGLRFYFMGEFTTSPCICSFKWEQKEIEVTSISSDKQTKWIEFRVYNGYRSARIYSQESVIEFLSEVENALVQEVSNPEQEQAFPATESHYNGLTKLEYFTAALLQAGESPQGAIAKAKDVIALLHPPARKKEQQFYSLTEVLAFEVPQLEPEVELAV